MQLQHSRFHSIGLRVCLTLYLAACALWLAGCGGGGGSPGASTATVNAAALVQQSAGPAGGSIVSSDGKLTLEIPAGALASAVTIGIEAIPLSALSAASRALNPSMAYRFTPDGLTFLTPVTVRIASNETPALAAGSISVDIGAATLESSSGVLEQVKTGVVLLANNRQEQQVSISHFSDLAYQFLVDKSGFAGNGSTVKVTYPDELFIGESGVLRITYTVKGNGFSPLESSSNPNNPRAQTSVRYVQTPTNDSELNLSINGTALESDTLRPGLIGSAPNLGERSGFIDIPFTCTRAGPEGRDSSVTRISLSVDIGGIYVGTSFGNRSDRSNQDEAGTIDILIKCKKRPTSIPIFGPVETPLTTADGLKFPVVIPAPGGSTSGVLVTGTGGAALLNPATGAVQRSFNTSAFSGTTSFQNGIVLYPPTGQGGNPALVLSSSTTRGLVQPLDANTGAAVGAPTFTSGINAGFGLIGLFAPTAQPTEFINRQGSSFTSAGKVQVFRLAAPPATGLVVNREVTLPSVFDETLSSATALPAIPLPDLSRVLYPTVFFNPVNSTTTYRLRLADYTGPSPVSTLIDTLGQNSQKLVCDSATGLCAVSNCSFPSNFVGVYRWQGGPAVTVGPRVASTLDCAFALDVFGNRIVVAGFNDNQYAVGTVDFNNGLNTVFTAPRALPAGCRSPNSITFQRDAQNTVVVACGGATPGVAVIPGAY